MEDQIGKVALQTIWEQKVQGCTRCALHETRTKIVFGIGNTERPDLAFVGEGPGADEDRTGLPFVGAAGKLLTKIVEAMGLKRGDVYICNVVACFPGDSLVAAPGVQGAYRRWYDGELLRVRTSGGVLTGTPNHPALTSRGWVALRNLTQDDDLIRCRFDEGVLTSDPHVHDGPSKIEDLFHTLLEAGVSERVVERDVNFHGDGGQSEVEIVSLQGLLTNRNHTSFTQHLLQLALEVTDHASGVLEVLRSGAGSLPMFFGGAPLLATGDSCGACQLSPIFFGGLGKPKRQRLAPSSHRNAFLDQVPTKPALPDPSLLRERLKRLPGDVAFNKVVEIESSRFVGHVYNLYTASEWYTTDGYIVSNCRPPGNRDPEPEELTACMPVWTSQIIAVRPRMIIALGKVAGNVLLGTKDDSVAKMRAKLHAWQGIPVQVTYHPAGMLRNETYKQPAWEDFQIAMATVAAMKSREQDAGPLFGGTR